MVSPTLYETIQSWATWTRRWVTKHGQEIGVYIDPGRSRPVQYGDILVGGHGDYIVNLSDELGVRIMIDPATRMGGRPNSIALVDRRKDPLTINDPCLKAWLGTEADELIPRHHEEE